MLKYPRYLSTDRLFAGESFPFLSFHNAYSVRKYLPNKLFHSSGESLAAFGESFSSNSRAGFLTKMYFACNILTGREENRV